MLNHVDVMGRLTRDPELRRTQAGVAVTTFFLAVERDFKDKATGEKGTDFFPIVCWRGTAEFAARYLAKGRTAVISGRLQTREYTDREGNQKTATEILADSVYPADSKRQEGQAQTAFQEVDDDDVPF